ncbi:hypothetical protein DVA67_020345 [Solirubrobacter sp. CPCC 204708]|uniref:Flagellar assembly protein FliH/Type III secretion system HrpE domain-containing protein n=1 Tax=Solirubrobacter deserti TaxID=2282478 RepID=A0ABT4RTN5_9ACTN|nr:hypothetical protein [Solirubrobacter deserti]MBE2318343.1 hypothetical protein [Solirubrobacter deserti]MDA0141941.1 hypothetical protein [Solirubrobacter deserti]
MSGVTIPLRVIAGAATAAELAAARDRFLAGRRVRVQTACAARSASTAMERLAARREAVGRCAPPRLRAAADAALARAVSAPTRVATRDALAAVEALEQAEERAALARAEQELVLARLVNALPEGMVPGTQARRTADGTLSVRTSYAGGQVDINLAADGRALALDMAASGVHELQTSAGALVGCEAELALSRRMAETWRRAGIDVAVAEPEAPAGRAAHAAGRGAGR